MNVPAQSHSSPQTQRFDVAVVGAGIVGLAMAKCLADGLGPTSRVALISDDRGSASGGDARATSLSATSVRMLQVLGVWDACRQQAQPVTSIDITDSSLSAGIRPVLLSYANSVQSNETASQIIPNAVLHAALLASVTHAPSVSIITSAASTFETQPNTITVSLANGASIAASILVAADGSKSPLRQHAGIATIGWPYEQTGITVVVGHDRPHNGRAVQHFLPQGPFALLPLTGDRTCITWSEDKATAAKIMAQDDASFLAELDLRCGGVLGTLTLLSPRQSWPLEIAVARAFAADRFALVGDAAHNVHPIAGQGLNLGLRDCAALAEVLVDADRLGQDLGSKQHLQHYERWRRFDTWSAAATFDGLNRLFSTSGTLRRSAREWGLGVIDALPAVKRRLVEEAAGVTGDVPRLLRGEVL